MWSRSVNGAGVCLSSLEGRGGGSRVWGGSAGWEFGVRIMQRNPSHSPTHLSHSTPVLPSPNPLTCPTACPPLPHPHTPVPQHGHPFGAGAVPADTLVLRRDLVAGGRAVPEAVEVWGGGGEGA